MNEHINIDELADLARIEMSIEEKESIRKDIESILMYVRQVQEVPMEDDGNDMGMHYNIMREDVEVFEPKEYTKALLDNAPHTETTKEGVYVKVKKIL